MFAPYDHKGTISKHSLQMPSRSDKMNYKAHKQSLELIVHMLVVADKCAAFSSFVSLFSLYCIIEAADVS